MASNFYSDKSVDNENPTSNFSQEGFIDPSATRRNRTLKRSLSYVGIVIPESEEDIHAILERIFEIVQTIKDGKDATTLFSLNPSGLLLDRDKKHIHLGRAKLYLEGPIKEYLPTGFVLGLGETAGKIIVVQDNMLEKKHALKTMVLQRNTTEFREEEILCWVAMRATEYVPSLYLFQIVGEKALMHMELLDNALTIKRLIAEYQPELISRCEDGQNLLKPLSLFVLLQLLYGLRALNKCGWIHNDLSDQNVMVRCTQPDVFGENLKVIILDFGDATRQEPDQEDSCEAFQKDYEFAVENFYDVWFFKPVNSKEVELSRRNADLLSLWKQGCEIKSKGDAEDFVQEVEKAL